MNRVFVVGEGMTKFEKPGRREGWDYPQMAQESGSKALTDAGIDYTEVEQGYVGYVAGDSTCGQRALYELGMTGIPIVNVNNNCSTGSTALYLGAQAIRGGLADCVLALGFEKMQPGSLGGGADDRESPMKRHILALNEIDDMQFPVAPWMFGAAGREHMRKYGTTAEHFAKIGFKNHKHSVNNPYAQFQDEYSLDDILGVFVDERGERALAIPPDSGVNRLAWIIPSAAIVIGIFLVTFWARTWSRDTALPSTVAEQTGTPTEEGAAPPVEDGEYIDRLEDELAALDA